MRDALEEFTKKGGNLAFFTGNTCCWQVRLEDFGGTMVSYKTNYKKDPVYKNKGDLSTLTSAWSDPQLKRPENIMMGPGLTWGGYHHSSGKYNDESTYTVYRPEHWVFEGTGLKKGDKLGNAKDRIVGYECDGCETVFKDGLPYPTHSDGTPENFEILAQAPAHWKDFGWLFPDERVGNSSLGVFQRNGTVFTVGSTDWSRGLRGNDENEQVSASRKIVERITKNVIDKLSK
jgi:hypothetical protein